jgi:hypothetical protein
MKIRTALTCLLFGFTALTSTAAHAQLGINWYQGGRQNRANEQELRGGEYRPQGGEYGQERGGAAVFSTHRRRVGSCIVDVTGSDVDNKWQVEILRVHKSGLNDVLVIQTLPGSWPNLLLEGETWVHSHGCYIPTGAPLDLR